MRRGGAGQSHTLPNIICEPANPDAPATVAGGYQ